MMKANETFLFRKDNGMSQAIDRFCLKKHLLSNFYVLTSEDVEYIKTDKSLLLKCQFSNFYRLYIMTDDLDEMTEILSSVPEKCVINIPSRHYPEVWDEIMMKTNFNKIAKYSRFSYSDYRKGHNRDISFATLGDIPDIEKRLLEFFNPLTGHLPSSHELMEMIKDKSIIINKDINGVLTGAICYRIKGRVAELPFWFDKEGKGLNLLYNVFYLCHQKEIKKISFWVNDTNKDVINIHTLLGAKEDGLSDYIYYNGDT